MKISVIIPTYKPKDYIWECLGSLERQTLSKKEFEVILVLNGCGEPYRSQIEKYLTDSDLNVNFIQTDVPGVSNARNIGLDKAKGEYIAFIDDDDYVSPSYLEELLNISSPDTIGLCYPYAFNDGSHTQLLHYYITETYNKMSHFGKQSFSLKVRRFFNGPCMKLIHKTIIGNRRFDVRFANGEDALYMFTISELCKNVNFTDRQTIYYRRIRINSACTSKKTKSYIIKTAINLIVAYSKVYWRAPLKYRITLYCNRLFAVVKGLFFI